MVSLILQQHKKILWCNMTMLCGQRPKRKYMVKEEFIRNGESADKIHEVFFL